MFKLLGIVLAIAAAIAGAMIACGYTWARSLVIACLALIVIGGTFIALLIYGGDP